MDCDCTFQKIKNNIHIQAITNIKAICRSGISCVLDFYRITIKIIGFNAFTVVETMHLFVVLDPLIKIFIQVALVIVPLSLVGVISLLKKIEKDNPDRIHWM